MTAPLVSVVIVSYGTRDLTLAALRSIDERAREISLEAVVVDNASPDDSADAVAREHPRVILIRAEENRGFAAGANRGARHASGEWLLFLNSDARLTEGALRGILREAGHLERPGAVGPRLEGLNGVERSAGHYYGPWRDFVRAFHLYRLFPRSSRFEEIHWRRIPDQPTPVDWLSGACLLVRRDVFSEIGGFDEAFFMYVEDMDLCYRLAKAGRTNLYVPGAVVYHEQGKSPRSRAILVEGGDAAEYFVQKTGMRYPLVLQRSLQAITLLSWMAILGGRVLMARLRRRSPDNSSASLRACWISLVALLRRPPRRRTSMGNGEPTLNR